jgi:hypothetical protein
MRLCNPVAPLRESCPDVYQHVVLCCRSAVGATTNLQPSPVEHAVVRCTVRSSPLPHSPSSATPENRLPPLGHCCAHPGSVGGWIVLHATNSLVHWCIKALVRPCGESLGAWVQRFADDIPAPRFPNSRGPAPHLRYRSSTLSAPSIILSNTFPGRRQPEDPFNRPTCSH